MLPTLFLFTATSSDLWVYDTREISKHFFKKALSTVTSVFLDAFENDGMNVFEFISEAVPSIIWC